MLKKIIDYLLRNYNKNDYIQYQKASILIAVVAASFVVAISFLIGDFFQDAIEPEIIWPKFISIFLCVIYMYFLQRGYYVIVSHAIMITVLSAVWSTMFLEEGSILQRLDTIIIAISFLALTPLIGKNKRIVIYSYYVINVFVLFLFAAHVRLDSSITDLDLIEYTLDSVIAFFIAGVISFQVYRINDNALKRVSESELKLIHKNDELKAVNEELMASMEELEATNEEFEAMNNELINSQQEFEQSEARFRILHNASFGGIGIHDNGVILDANQGLTDLTGYEYDELIGMNGLLLVAGEHRDLVLNNIRSGYEEPYDVTGLKKNGTRYNLEIQGKEIPYHGKTVRVAEFRDITIRKKAVESLQESEERYRLLAENVTDVIWSMDMNFRFMYISPSILSMYGYTVDEALDISITDWMTETSYNGLMDLFNHEMELEKSGNADPHRDVTVELEQYKKDRTRFFTECKIIFMRNENLKAIGIAGITRDITERKKAEEDLLREKERLSVTLRSIGDGVITTDTEQNVVLLNRAAEMLTGWTLEEAEGRPVVEIFNIIDQEEHGRRINPVEIVLDTGQQVDLEKNIRIKSKDEVVRIIADSGAPIRNREGDIIGVVLVFRDVTEREFMQNELNKMQQLESIGVLAGGIAHDFNNILSAILGNISLARMEGVSDEEATKSIRDAEKATLKARELTAQLLTFSKGGTPIRESSLIQEIISDSVDFALRGSNVKCIYDIMDDLWHGDVDRGQIGQVVQNLVINAKQAMPDGGTVSITVENMIVARGSKLPLKPGDYIKIEISDSGSGIPHEDLEKVFDPYFSTKKTGHGLGLSVVYSIVKRHDGYILVESETGTGTAFKIFLPASKNKAVTRDISKADEKHERGKVLFMDDEEPIRHVAERMLKAMDCEIVLTSNGSEAVAAYVDALDNDTPFDLVIMDITIPGGMGGKETIRELLKIDPDIKAIISSGYSNDPVMSEYQKHGFKAVIAKPYKVEEMREMLDMVLKEEVFPD